MFRGTDLASADYLKLKFVDWNLLWYGFWPIFAIIVGCSIVPAALQSLTGKYRGLQGNPCNENRDPVMRTGVHCNENRFFPVGMDYGHPMKA